MHRQRRAKITVNAGNKRVIQFMANGFQRRLTPTHQNHSHIIWTYWRMHMMNALMCTITLLPLRRRCIRCTIRKTSLSHLFNFIDSLTALSSQTVCPVMIPLDLIHVTITRIFCIVWFGENDGIVCETQKEQIKMPSEMIAYGSDKWLRKMD